MADEIEAEVSDPTICARFYEASHGRHAGADAELVEASILAEARPRPHGCGFTPSTIALMLVRESPPSGSPSPPIAKPSIRR
jgi:hypothetical protein